MRFKHGLQAKFRDCINNGLIQIFKFYYLVMIKKVRINFISQVCLSLFFVFVSLSVFGQTTYYWKGSGTWTSTNQWSLTSGGTYNQTWVSGRAAVFNVASSTITGATTNVSSITANENVTFSASGTLGTGGTVAPIFVASGKNFNFSTQAISTAAGTGFIKNGTGTLQLAGGTFAGGVTLNDGMIAVGGVNAMGSGGTLTINGGIIAGTTNRDLTGKYTGGITIGGDFTLGSSTSPASGTATLIFTNNTSLGNSTTRTITLGGTGLITWNGIISGSSSNLVINSTVANAIISLGGANTYTGSTTIGTNATLRLGATNSLPVGGAGLVLNGGTLRTGATTGFSVGTVSTNAGTLDLAANSTIALGTGNHSLYFAASNGVTWNGSTLTITGWTGNDGESGTAGKIFVGNSASGLTSGQLAKITINSKTVTQLSTGEIVPRATLYQSKISGNWSSTSTWERSLDGGATWEAAVATPTSADGTITILDGHTVTIGTSVTIDQVVVNSGGTLNLNLNVTLTINNGPGDDLDVYGTFIQTTGSITNNGQIKVQDGGLLRQAKAATVIPTATWESGSTCEVTGWTAAIGGGLNQSFSNFTWNCTGQNQNLILEPTTMSISGLFKVLSTNTSYILAIGNTSTTRSLTVGSLQVSGGNFVIAGGSATAAMNLIVSGNCLIDAGSGSLQVSRTIGSANSLTVNGTTTLSSGRLLIQNAGSASANSNVNSAILIGNVTINGGTLDLVANANDVGPGRVFVRGDLTLSSGAIQNTRNISTGTSGIFFDGTSTQTFTHSGGTLSTATGGVGRRFFYKTSSGPTINEVYSASSTQTTVNGTEPSSLGVAGYAAWPTSGSTINNVTINNSAGVTLSTAKQVNGALTLTSGKLTIGANTLTLNGTVGSMSTLNSLIGSSTSNLNIGGTGALGTLFFDQTTSGTTNALQNVTINRTSTGSATLGNALTVGGTLTLTNGNIITTSTNTLTLGSVATISGGSSSSYIEGPLDRTLTNSSSFAYPIGGNSTNYRPVSLNSVSVTGNPVVRVTV
jgi:hypothetical protein